MIDWPAFFVVLVATMIAASAVVTLYSLGLRLVDSSSGRSGAWQRPLGIACFVACALVVLYGVYLVIPYFHQ
jgi:succinate dehydrogenase hydrophobic anchor subunit